MRVKENFFEEKHKVWLFVLLFLLVLVPWALRFIMFFPDENHYSDAAMYMLERGDYFTPHIADGSLRFHKPILNYWVMLGSYKLFGVSQWSTRLPFLLCGGLILFLCFEIGKLLFTNRKHSLYPALILAANPLFAFTVTKSITDTYLLLFVTLSLYGILGLLLAKENEDKAKFFWAMYVGCGLAAATKGIPAVVFTGIGGLFLLLNPWKRYSLWKLLHWPSLLTGIALAVFWYVAIYLQHGQTALQEFYGDQVGQRFDMTIPHFLRNFGGMIAATVVCFAPFLFLLFKKYGQLSITEKTVLWFAAIYYALLVIMASFTDKFFYRYLLQGFSLLAVALSILLVRLDREKALKGLRAANLFFFGLWIFLFIVTCFNAWVFHAGMGVYLSLLVAFLLIVALFWFFSSHIVPAQLAKLALVIPALFILVAFFIQPISYPGSGKQIAANTKKIGIDLNQQNVQFYANQQAGGRFRVATKGKPFVPQIREKSVTEIPENTYVIYTNEHEEAYDAAGVRKELIASYWSDLPYDQVIKARFAGKEEYEKIKAESAKEYYLVWRE